VTFKAILPFFTRIASSALKSQGQHIRAEFKPTS
jgi:hypothetical protein